MSDSADQPERDDDRRRFIKTATSVTMVGGLAAGYGTFAAYAGRFLYPVSTSEPYWQFVSRVQDLRAGESLSYKTPDGAQIVIARQGDGDTAEDFVALSSICPHLGCQVHWEAVNDRFFCPCHNGAFNSSGEPTEGPPAKANQHLTRFPLKVENGLLYIDVPTDMVSNGETA